MKWFFKKMCKQKLRLTNNELNFKNKLGDAYYISVAFLVTVV